MRDLERKWSGHIGQAHDTHHVLFVSVEAVMTCIVNWGPLHLAESPMMSKIEDVAPEYHFSQLFDLPVWIDTWGRSYGLPLHQMDHVVDERRNIQNWCMK